MLYPSELRGHFCRFYEIYRVAVSKNLVKFQAFSFDRTAHRPAIGPPPQGFDSLKKWPWELDLLAFAQVPVVFRHRFLISVGDRRRLACASF